MHDAKAYHNRLLAKHEEAIKDYDKAIELKPDFAEAYFDRGLAKYKLSEYKEAIANLTQAIHIKPKQARVP